MRGRVIEVAGRKVELVIDRYMHHGILWRAYLEGEGDCLNLGFAHHTRRDLVAWLRSPAGERIVRES